MVTGPEGDGGLVALDPIYFLKRQSRPISGIRGAAMSVRGASEVLIVGHTAILTGLNISNERLSWDRANNVKALLRKAGVRAKITTMGLSGTAPLTRVMTERAQAANRRVMIYVIP